MLLGFCLWSPAFAGVKVVEDGKVVVDGDDVVGKVKVEVKLPKWGMYDRVVKLKGGGEKVLGRVYFPKEGKVEVDLEGTKGVELLTLVPAPEGDEVLQKRGEPVVLLAKDATVWGKKLRYEPKDVKQCIGYWTVPDDWASWDFALVDAGTYSVSVVQGCGKGHGGSRAEIEVGGKKFGWDVIDTGGFQSWKEIELGDVELSEVGKVTLAVRALSKKKVAVMDVQRITLRKK